MTTSKKTTGASGSKVGYGQPPVEGQFKKGKSGNPGGRPRRMTSGRATALALKEAYRTLTVRVGDVTVTMPAIQAILRSQVALAAKGNGPAQRFFFETVQAIEQNVAMQKPSNTPDAVSRSVSDMELAKALVLIFAKNAPQPLE